MKLGFLVEAWEDRKDADSDKLLERIETCQAWTSPLFKPSIVVQNSIV